MRDRALHVMNNQSFSHDVRWAVEQQDESTSSNEGENESTSSNEGHNGSSDSEEG